MDGYSISVISSSATRRFNGNYGEKHDENSAMLPLFRHPFLHKKPDREAFKWFLIGKQVLKSSAQNVVVTFRIIPTVFSSSWAIVFNPSGNDTHAHIRGRKKLKIL